ncbi:apoptosis-antagonizing transcription factor [Aspergillus californicus]
MAPKSLAEQIAELEDLTPRDFDPEDIERGGNTSDEDVDVKDADAGRGHYQAVGKGKLRNDDPISLGKEYAGSRVSRDALEAESDDDPFAARSGDEDSEEDSEEEDISEGSEDERPQKLNKAGKKGQEEVDESDMDGSDDEDDEDDMENFDEEMSDEDEDEDEDEEEEKPRRVKFADPKSDDREELRQLMATDQKTIAATISQAAKTDATKGKSVKQQRATFDALLNTRIKLQKGLTTANQITAAAQTETLDDDDALKSAESAALTLWSTLEDLRLTLADAQTQDESKKRKRPFPASQTTSTSSLWKRMVELESDAVSHRRAILDKWSTKVRGTHNTLANSKTKLIGAAASQQSITAVLDAHIASETADLRAAKRARKHSTNGTAAGSTEAQPDQTPTYDDASFYQSLLRDLVEQRMSSSDAITNGLDTLHILPSRDVHHVTGMRKDKVKKEIDTRASKGRKMRFEVHEKLQNFMAPEDRGVWTGRAREEFFASLLGRTASGLLREDESGSEAGSEDEGEAGLMLFRS